VPELCDPSGVGDRVDRVRWFRCAQPPANICDPSGVFETSEVLPSSRGTGSEKKPASTKVASISTDDIACWFIDTVTLEEEKGAGAGPLPASALAEEDVGS
jgi:hypothetical protein